MAKTRPTHTRTHTFRLGDEITTAMEALEARDGIPPSEQARRAFVAFLTDKGFPPATPSPGTLAAQKAWKTRTRKEAARKAWVTMRAKKGVE